MIHYINEHKILKNTLCIFFSYLSSLAIAYIFGLGKDISNDYEYTFVLNYGYNLIAVGVFILGAFLLLRFLNIGEKRLIVFSAVMGLLLSVLTVSGAYILFVNDIFISVQISVLQIFLILGLSIFMIPLCAEVLQLMDRFSKWCNHKQMNIQYTHKSNTIYFLSTWLIIFLAYVPLFLTWWPGNFIYDARYQLNGAVQNVYDTHHPLLHTWLMDVAYKKGIEWGNPSQGFQFYTLLQMLVVSSAFAYCALYLRKRGLPKIFRVIVIVWFAIFPMHSIFAITATKDVLFAAFFLYTAILCCRYFFDKEKFRWYTYIGLVVSGVLSALFRNNAIYSFVLFFIIAVFFVKGLWRKGKVVLLLLSIYICTAVCNHVLITNLATREAHPYRESLSVPLQCMARVADYRGEELKEEYFTELCRYVNPADMYNYNPFLSDPVKNNANEELLKSNFSNFMKLWLKIGLEFPDEYIESFISNTLGYWYFFPMNDYVTMNLSLHHTLIEAGPELVKKNYCNFADAIYYDLFCNLKYKFVPVLGYSFRIAPYIWLIMFALFWSVMRKNRRSALMLLLPLAYFATCLLAPIAALRYIYALIVCCPLYFYVLKKSTPEE